MVGNGELGRGQQTLRTRTEVVRSRMSPILAKNGTPLRMYWSRTADLGFLRSRSSSSRLWYPIRQFRACMGNSLRSEKAIWSSSTCISATEESAAFPTQSCVHHATPGFRLEWDAAALDAICGSADAQDWGQRSLISARACSRVCTAPSSCASSAVASIWAN